MSSNLQHGEDIHLLSSSGTITNTSTSNNSAHEVRHFKSKRFGTNSSSTGKPLLGPQAKLIVTIIACIILSPLLLALLVLVLVLLLVYLLVITLTCIGPVYEYYKTRKLQRELRPKVMDLLDIGGYRVAVAYSANIDDTSKPLVVYGTLTEACGFWFVTSLTVLYACVVQQHTMLNSDWLGCTMPFNV